MLNILRKQASSWMTKVIFGAIIVTFIFFFGYSTLRKSDRTRGGDAVVAKVNGNPITAPLFQYFFDITLDRFKESFQGKEVPDFLRELATNTTMNQAISRELALEQANKLGVVITDQELADIIRQMQVAQREGTFDPTFYRHTFLPYFENRYGLDFEAFMRQDIELSSFEDVFSSVDGMGLGEPPPPENVTWKFEKITIDPKALVESKVIKSEEEAKSITSGLSSIQPKGWRQFLKNFNIQPEEVGPIKIFERERLLGNKAKLVDMKQIFSLTTEKSTLEKPIEHDGKLFVFRLIEKKQDEKASSSPTPSSSFFAAWLARLEAKAKIENYLKEETPEN